MRLAAWLERLERRAPESRIELGLDRVGRVLERLGSAIEPPTVVTVAGTNGKGSVVAFLEQAGLAAGLRTYAYTSPHLVDFRERFRLNGELPAADVLIAALDRVERARGQEFLTYFEHITLAGLVLASRAACDLWVLEVGLGGRLDAVNIIDPDVAVITSIGLDHTEWLGPTRLHVGREKAGIARPGRPLIVGERRRPSGLGAMLKASGANLCLAGKDFRWRRLGSGFRVYFNGDRMTFPAPAMAGDWQIANAATAVMAFRALAVLLDLPEQAMHQSLEVARISGRLQQVSDQPEVFVDVAHNPAAARALAGFLGPTDQRPVVAVFSALADKDVTAIARALGSCFSHWLVVPLPGPRSVPVERLVNDLHRAAVPGAIDTLKSVVEAVRHAQVLAGPDGRVVVFGSFRTVAEALPLFASQ